METSASTTKEQASDNEKLPPTTDFKDGLSKEEELVALDAWVAMMLERAEKKIEIEEFGEA